MAFNQVLKGRGTNLSGSRVVVAANGKTRQVAFRITKDVFEALGSPASVEFFAGSGEDTGSVLIAPSDGGPNSYSIWALKSTPHLYTCAVSTKKIGLDAPDIATEAAFEIAEDGLVVTMPEVRATQPRTRRVVSRLPQAA